MKKLMLVLVAIVFPAATAGPVSHDGVTSNESSDVTVLENWASTLARSGCWAKCDRKRSQATITIALLSMEDKQLRSDCCGAEDKPDRLLFVGV